MIRIDTLDVCPDIWLSEGGKSFLFISVLKNVWAYVYDRNNSDKNLGSKNPTLDEDHGSENVTNLDLYCLDE